jgi:hypothetical protein
MVRLATGNLLVAVAVVGVTQLGWPALLGAAATVGAMAVTGREWAALPAGAAAAAAMAALTG